MIDVKHFHYCPKLLYKGDYNLYPKYHSYSYINYHAYYRLVLCVNGRNSKFKYLPGFYLWLVVKTYNTYITLYVWKE